MARQEAAGWYQADDWASLVEVLELRAQIAWSARNAWPERYHRPVRKLIKIALLLLGIRALPPLVEAAARPRGAVRPLRARAPIPPTSCVASSPSHATTTPQTGPAAPEASVADRRAEVHEQGRATLDEMKSSDES